MSYDELLKNAFLQFLFEETQKFIKKEFKNNPKLENRNAREKMPNKEKYIVDTFQRATETLFKIESLSYYIAFVNSYPKTKMWDKTFGRADFIRYHTEAYLNGISGVFDRCLLLVNQVYDLGIQEKYAKYEIIISNKHLQKSPTKKVLVIFNKAITKIKALRNFSNHQGRYADKELDKMSTYEFLLRSNAKFTKKQKNIIKFLVLKFGFNSYINKKKKEINENNKKINQLCDVLFSTLLDKFKSEMDNL